MSIIPNNSDVELNYFIGLSHWLNKKGGWVYESNTIDITEEIKEFYKSKYNSFVKISKRSKITPGIYTYPPFNKIFLKNDKNFSIILQTGNDVIEVFGEIFTTTLFKMPFKLKFYYINSTTNEKTQLTGLTLATLIPEGSIFKYRICETVNLDVSDPRDVVNDILDTTPNFASGGNVSGMTNLMLDTFNGTDTFLLSAEPKDLSKVLMLVNGVKQQQTEFSINPLTFIVTWSGNFTLETNDTIDFYYEFENANLIQILF